HGIAKLAMKPAQSVRQTPANKQVLALLCLGHPLTQRPEPLGVVPDTPGGKADEGETVQLMETIIGLAGSSLPVVPDSNGTVEIPTPVGNGAEIGQRKAQGSCVPFLLADPERLLEVLLRYLQIATHLIHGTKARETPRQDTAITGGLGKPLCLQGIVFHLGNVRF